MKIEDTVRICCVNGKGLSKEAVTVRWSKDYSMKHHPDLHDHFDNVWNEKLKQCTNLFNASKFRYQDVQIQYNEDSTLPNITFFLGPTNYKEFIGTNDAPYAKKLAEDGIAKYADPLAFMSNPVGVGALLQTVDKNLVFMRRSHNCAEMQNMIDRPGGHPEPDEVIKICNQSLEHVDPVHITDEIFDSVLKEIRDEINIPIAKLSTPELLGISYNPNTWMRPSLEFFVRCHMQTADVLSLYMEQTQSESEESTELVFMPVNEVSNTNILNHYLYREFTPPAKSAVYLFQIFNNLENS